MMNLSTSCGRKHRKICRYGFVALPLVAFMLALAPNALPAQQEPPQVFIGVATINDNPVPPDIRIVAYDDTGEISSTQSKIGGVFGLHLPYSQSTIRFEIAGFRSTQTVSWVNRHELTWSDGSFSGLTAYSSKPVCFAPFTQAGASGYREVIGASPLTSPCYMRKIPVANVLDWTKGQIEAVFTFNNETKKWLFYDPEVPEFSDLQDFQPGTPYFILVTRSFKIYLNEQQRELTCVNGNCWNLIVW